MKNIIEFIKEDMASKGMTYGKLAAYAGMTKSNLWDKINKRVYPNFGNVKKILKGLGYNLIIEEMEDCKETDQNKFFEIAEEEQVSYECVESLLMAIGYELRLKSQNNEKNVKEGIDS